MIILHKDLLSLIFLLPECIPKGDRCTRKKFNQKDESYRARNIIIRMRKNRIISAADLTKYIFKYKFIRELESLEYGL